MGNDPNQEYGINSRCTSYQHPESDANDISGYILLTILSCLIFGLIYFNYFKEYIHIKPNAVFFFRHADCNNPFVDLNTLNRIEVLEVQGKYVKCIEYNRPRTLRYINNTSITTMTKSTLIINYKMSKLLNYDSIIQRE